MQPTTRKSYGTISKILHWLIGITIIAMLAIGFFMIDMPSSPLKWKLFFYHKATGFTVLWLVIIRLWWRLRNPVPALPTSTPLWQKFLADVTVWILYALMFMMPISGFILSVMAGYPLDYFGLFTIPAFTTTPTETSKLAVIIHSYAAYAIIGLVALHVLAGLYHHFVYKDNVLKKMLPNFFNKKRGG